MTISTSMSAASVYRALASPHPDHPGLQATRPSYSAAAPLAEDNQENKNSRDLLNSERETNSFNPTPSSSSTVGSSGFSALSALSTILLGGSNVQPQTSKASNGSDKVGADTFDLHLNGDKQASWGSDARGRESSLLARRKRNGRSTLTDNQGGLEQNTDDVDTKFGFFGILPSIASLKSYAGDQLAFTALEPSIATSADAQTKAKSDQPTKTSRPLSLKSNYTRRPRSSSSSSDDLPPSPVRFPGAWTVGKAGPSKTTSSTTGNHVFSSNHFDRTGPNVRQLHGQQKVAELDNNDESTTGALFLPPPFLDESSTRDSFEGVLGTKATRQQLIRARREARQYARDRPPPPAFPSSLLRTASKIVYALGPPPPSSYSSKAQLSRSDGDMKLGGLSVNTIDGHALDRSLVSEDWRDARDAGEAQTSPPLPTRRPNPEASLNTGRSASYVGIKERRRVERAERGMKGFEVGEKWASKLAERLRRLERAQKEAVSLNEKAAIETVDFNPLLESTRALNKKSQDEQLPCELITRTSGVDISPGGTTGVLRSNLLEKLLRRSSAKRENQQEYAYSPEEELRPLRAATPLSIFAPIADSLTLSLDNYQDGSEHNEYESSTGSIDEFDKAESAGRAITPGTRYHDVDFDMDVLELSMGSSLISSSTTSGSTATNPLWSPLTNSSSIASSVQGSTEVRTGNISTPSITSLKGKLRPTFTESEPSPLPLLENEFRQEQRSRRSKDAHQSEGVSDMTSSLDGDSDGGYFSIQKTKPSIKNRRKRSSTLTAKPTVSRSFQKSIASISPAPAVSTTRIRSKSPSASSNGKWLDFASSTPRSSDLINHFVFIFLYTIKAVDYRVRGHFDLLVWILVGSPRAGFGPTDGLASVGGVLGLLMHLFGFSWFVMVHAVALTAESLKFTRSTVIFFKWVGLNAFGKTELSIVAREYFKLCRQEWDKVYEEDGVHMSAWGVFVGLLELIAVQAMTKERWLADGPGNLTLLNGEDMDFQSCPNSYENINNEKESTSKRSPTWKSPLLRPAISRRKTTKWGDDDDGAGDSLLVTGGADSILEGTIMNDQSFSPSSLKGVRTPRSPFRLTSRNSLERDAATDELPPLDLGDSLPGFSFSHDQPPILGPSSSSRRGSLLSASPVLHPMYTASPGLLPTSEKTVDEKNSMSPPLRPLPEEDRLISLVKAIKRHVRLATASYGLHTYILAPPTPLFTPSGANLPHRIFGHLGGVEGKNVLHVAIQKHSLGITSAANTGDDGKDEDDYAPQYYLLRDDINCEVIVVVRGTQSLSDIRVDLEASTQIVKLPSLCDSGNSEEYRVHAGILAAAQRLLDPKTSLLFAKLKTALEDHPGYSVCFTGHSLGAGIASTVAFLIGEYVFPNTTSALQNPSGSAESIGEDNVSIDPKVSGTTPVANGTWVVNKECGLAHGRLIKATCFAHPTTVDVALSKRCAIGIEPLVLSVSLGPDAVCRMGIPQVREVRRALGRLTRKRRKFLQAKLEGEHGKSEILAHWWKWRKLGGGEPIPVGPASTQSQGNCETIPTENPVLKAIEKKAWAWRREMDGLSNDKDDNNEENSSAPCGRAQKSAQSDAFMMIPAGKALHVDRLTPALEAKRRAVLEKAKAELEIEDEDDDEDIQLWGLYEVGDPETFFSAPHIESDMVSCHLPRYYLDAIESL